MDTTQTVNSSGTGRLTDRGQRRRRFRVAAALIAVTLGVAACGTDAGTRVGSSPRKAGSATTSAPSTAESAVTRPTGSIDRLVGSAGARVHVRCVGTGQATVVLISGFGADSTAWSSIEPAVSGNARVCSYDRPGTGTSDAPTSTATFASQARDLHRLLVEVGEPGPYIVVGHSFGGAAAVTFASEFKDDVSGLVLVDASPATWPSVLCAVTADGSQGAEMLLDMCANAFPAAGNPERLDVRAAFAAVAEITTLGSLPTAVITAAERDLPADLAADERVRLNEQWNQGQQGWAALSDDSQVVTVDHTSHDIQLDQPQVVIDQITQLLP